MGYDSFKRMALPQLSKLIRSKAKNSASIFLSGHAKARMKDRKITMPQLYECLRQGTIVRQPEPNDQKGSLECRMERYVAGKNLGVLVALCDEDPTLIVITALYIG